MDKLTLQEQILLALFNGSSQSFLSYRPLGYLYRLFPQRNTGSLRVTVNLLAEEGMVEKVERNQDVYVSVTKSGLNFLFGKALFSSLEEVITHTKQDYKPLVVFKTGYWDKTYTLAVLNVPESKRPIRAQLRGLLWENNFRLWQAGIWICPGLKQSLVDKLNNEKILPYISLVKAAWIRSYADSDKNQGYFSLWDLDKTKKIYQALIAQARLLVKMKYFDALRYNDLAKWQENFLITLKNDPFFPDNFFPLNYFREKVARIFLILSQRQIL